MFHVLSLLFPSALFVFMYANFIVPLLCSHSAISKNGMYVLEVFSLLDSKIRKINHHTFRKYVHVCLICFIKYFCNKQGV